MNSEESVQGVGKALKGIGRLEREAAAAAPGIVSAFSAAETQQLLH